MLHAVMAKQPVVENTIPRAMPLLVGMTAGILAALVVAVQLAAREMSVGAAWSQLFGGGQVHFVSASVLWAIAGIALVVGAAASALLVRYPPPWHAFRALRWVIGTLILFGLAHVAHGAEAPHGVSSGMTTLADASAIVIAAVMGLFGALFARPR